MAELKPCPFCGAHLWWNDNEEDLYVRRYGPRYMHPDGVNETCYLRGEEVRPEEVDAWNRRTSIGDTPAPQSTEGADGVPPSSGGQQHE